MTTKTESSKAQRSSTKPGVGRNTRKSASKSAQASIVNPMVRREVGLLQSAIAVSNGQRNIRYALVTISLLSALSISLLLFKQQHYIAVDPVGRTYPVTSLDSPADRPAAITGFVERVLPEIMTFGHLEWRAHLGRAYSRYFTNRGAEQHMTALLNAGIDRLLGAEYAIGLRLDGMGAQIVSEGVNQGSRYFVVDYPAVLIYDPPGTGRDEAARLNPVVVRVVLVAVNPMDSESGLLIDQWVVGPRR